MQQRIEYPIIINKYLALKKICSRKESDRLLKAQKIKINGKLAEPGMMVNHGDKVEAETNNNLVYLAYNKPKWVITHSPQGTERCITDNLKFGQKVFPIGRLDKSSTGLIILTNDGRITDKLLNPDFYHEKEYEVRVDKPINAEFVRRMRGGIKLDDGHITRRCAAQKIGESMFAIVLTEGKKHQIRRMTEVLGFKVMDLKRIRIMNVGIGGLRVGEFRILKDKELETFLGLLDFG